MSTEDQNLDRVRQILQRMERSIDDARDRRLREGAEHPAQPHGLNQQATAADIRASQGTPGTQHQPSPNSTGGAKAPTGPVRFDEDGRPIVGRAKPKNAGNGPQNNSSYSSGSNWR